MLRRVLATLLVPSLFACAPMTEPLPDEDYETIYGGTFSGELRLYEVPSLGENSYVYLGAGGSYDNQENLEDARFAGRGDHDQFLVEIDLR